MTDANPQPQAAPTGSGSEQTPKVDPPALTDEMVKSHPLFQKLQEEHSAAEREKNRYKGRLDKVQKGISDEPEETPEPKDDTPYVTKDQLWEFQNKADIESYGDEQYKADVARGIPRDYALETAKLRYQANPDKARLERQQATASGPAASTRNLESTELEGFDPKAAAEWGYSKETWLKQQQLKKERGQI